MSARFVDFDTVKSEMEERADIFARDTLIEPYLFTDRKSADPAVYAGFSNCYDKYFTDDDITSEKSYSFVRKYLLSEHLSYYGDFAPLFDDISLEEWTELCSIIEGEETIAIQKKYKAVDKGGKIEA